MEASLGTTLTALARAAVATGFEPEPAAAEVLVARIAAPEAAAPLAEPAATFVTLEREGRLRGCIGSLTPQRPLAADVVRNARAAARDPRLPPVALEELPELTITVALISAAEPLGVDSFAGLLDRLRPGTDGLTLVGGRRRATFLPSVWKALTEPERFVAALLRKGGWPRALWTADLRRAIWPEGLTAECYTTETFTA